MPQTPVQVPSSLPQGETEATPVLSALEILEQEENDIDADEDSENEEQYEADNEMEEYMDFVFGLHQ